MVTCGLAVATAFGFAQSGPVAWWKFDETSGTTAFDSIGAVNGTLAGASSFASGGISNNCVSVPGGAGNYIDYANTFGFTSGAFSAVTWVNSTDTSSSSTVVLGKHHATIVAGWMLRVNQDSAGYGAPGKASFYVTEPNVGNVPVSSITVVDGKWHQIVGVYTGSSTLL